MIKSLLKEKGIFSRISNRHWGYFFVFFVVFVLIVSVKGFAGNPSIEELSTAQWTSNGPLELSPERGRFALLYSIVEDNSFVFSLPVAKFSTPDLGFNSSGEYVSLFAPAVSFLVIPGYVLGKLLGASQLGAYSVISIFALLNAVLVWKISETLGASKRMSIIGALVFLFATPAFSYATTLYQHHISVFVILASIYLLIRWRTWISFSAVWLLIAFSVVIDNPNFFLMFPIGVFALERMLFLKNEEDALQIRLRPAWILTLLVMIIPLVFFGWFNYQSNGSPTKLSGTLERIKEIDEHGDPTESSLAKKLKISDREIDSKKEKKALGFFSPRNMANGFFVYSFSLDRGILWYAPAILFGIIGIFFLYKKKGNVALLIISIAGINLLLYSMWGDAYGGWAFGSRYLIPAYSLLGIGIAFIPIKMMRSILFIGAFSVVGIYSLWVNSLGALTTIGNPPKVQVLSLEEITNEEQKYTFERNWDYLSENGSKSFVYQEFAGRYMSGRVYHFSVFSLIAIMFVSLIYQLRKEESEKNSYGKFE